MRTLPLAVLSLALLLPARSVRAQAEGGPMQAEGAAARAADTAGARLGEVFKKVRSVYRDARLTAISARTGPAGAVTCDRMMPFQDGWRYSFYSKASNAHVLMAECDGVVAGPLKEMRDAASEALRPVEGNFIDSDEAMLILVRRGISLDPRDYKLVGKRPFAMKLFLFNDTRLPEPRPAVWEVTLGGVRHRVDANKAALFDPAAYNVAPEVFLPPEELQRREANLAARPKKTLRRNDTAYSDLEKVRAYAAKKYPNGQLMAIEAIVDSWGGSPCVGPGDGWAYYFSFPEKKDFAAIFACMGDVGPGASANIPVSTEVHQPIAGTFVDSDAVLDTLLKANPQAMNEGLGRNYTRLGTLRLVNFKKPPFRDPALARTTLFWVFNLGNTRYTFDARDARLVDTRE